MKRFFAFCGKVTAWLTLLGVVFCCIGYFFAAKSKRLYDMFRGVKNNTDDIE